MGERPAPVDPAAIPALSGVFAPVTDEHDATDLVVVGAYLRNGPNALHPPLGSYTYPLDGDGMIHGVWFEEGSVRYRNRFVWTPHLRAEADAGRALWAGIMTPWFPGPDEVPAELANSFKPLPDINIIRHAGRYLALCEVDPPYEVTAELETVGVCDFGGVVPGMCAHPRVDPVTGELVLFRYDLVEPYLTWSVIAADGSVAVPPQVIDVDGSYMIHDCVITESYLVLFVGPLAFDLGAMLTGGGVLSWRPELGMRIALVPRDPARPVRWVTTDAFWVWHFANAFERPSAAGGTEVVVDYTEWSRPSLAPGGPVTGAVRRAVIDVDAGTVARDTFLDRTAEFARIDDRLTGREHRTFVCTTHGDDLAVGEQNTLLRIDTVTGSVASWDSGDDLFDEVIFVPAAGDAPEVGFYATFRTNRRTLTSDLVLLAADDIAAGSVVRVALPHRVPAGLHGNWIPDAR